MPEAGVRFRHDLCNCLKSGYAGVAELSSVQLRERPLSFDSILFAAPSSVWMHPEDVWRGGARMGQDAEAAAHWIDRHPEYGLPSMPEKEPYPGAARRHERA